MNPKETIKKNLERRSEFVDVVPIHKGVPIPTWIELSLIDVCNRKCTFCPKADEKVAPDTHQKMTRKIIDEIHDQLLEINFKGTISLCVTVSLYYTMTFLILSKNFQTLQK